MSKYLKCLFVVALSFLLILPLLVVSGCGKVPDELSGIETVKVADDNEFWTIFDSEKDNAVVSLESRSGYYFYNPVMILDRDDYPHFVWSAGNCGSVYIKWNGKNWICIDGSVYDPMNTDDNPAFIFDNLNVFSMKIDDNEFPHFACNATFSNNEYYLAYVRWDGNNLLCANGSIYKSSFMNKNNPAVVCLVSSPETYNNEYFFDIDSYGFPHLVWCDDFSDENNELPLRDIFYIKWDGKNWVCADGNIAENKSKIFRRTDNSCITNNNIKSWLIAMSLDRYDYPHLTFREAQYMSHENMVSIHWNGHYWINQNKSLYDPLSEEYAKTIHTELDGDALKYDKDGNPYVAWDSVGGSDSSMLYAKWDRNNWLSADGNKLDCSNGTNNKKNPANVILTRGSLLNPRVSLDDENTPHIVYRNTHHGDYSELGYIKWDGKNWVSVDGKVFDSLQENSEIIFSCENDICQFNSVIDKNGYPHIIWIDQFLHEDNRLNYIRWNGKNWVTPTG